MHTRHALLVTLSLLTLAGPARAQDLATALAGRYPSRELVPQSCAMRDDQKIVLSEGRICLRDRATGLVRAVRRIALSGDWSDTSAVAREHDVLFAVTDQGGASTRFAGRVWRWDLGRDAYLGIAAVESARIVETPFGALYRAQAGWRRVTDGDASATRVQVPDELTAYGVTTFTHEGTAYVVDNAEGIGVDVSTLALEGRAVRTREHAEVPGTLLYADHGVIVTADQARRGAFALRVLRLPATEPVTIPYPAGMRRPTGAAVESPGVLRISGPRGERALLDLAQGTVTRADASTAPSAPELLRASSLLAVQPAPRGLFVRASSGGFLLDGSGVTTPRRDPRAPRVRCACAGLDLVCRAPAATIAGACAEVPELDVIRSEDRDAPSRATQFTGDGAFRIDRLEADHVRVTRLRDGARLWVRVLGGALFAQADDGTYFLSNRALATRFALRDGPLATGAVAPLGARAESLYRERLIADFFAP